MIILGIDPGYGITGVALIDASTTDEELTPAISVPKETPCVFIFTGGTTGKSKAARLSHRASFSIILIFMAVNISFKYGTCSFNSSGIPFLVPLYASNIL